MTQLMIDFLAPFQVSDRSRFTMNGYDLRAYSNTELLESIIGSGTGEVLSSANHSLVQLGYKNISELVKLNGITQEKALKIMAVIELGKRRYLEPHPLPYFIRNSEDAVHYFSPLLADLPHEEFWVMFLRTNSSVIRTARVSLGGVSATIVDAKIIFKLALENGAAAILVCHNHPSANVLPSDQDSALTIKLCEGARFLDLYISDHLIIGKNDYFSFVDHGLVFR